MANARRVRRTKPPPPPPPTPKPHPVVKWSRAAGIAGLLLGLGSLILAGWFWAGIGFIYASALLLLIDLWVEPDLTRKWRIGLALVLIAGGMAFGWSVVFAKAPLGITAMVTDAEYPAGATISGVPWRKEFTELRLTISNPTNSRYDDLSLLIRPTEPIASINQISTNVPGVYFTDKNEFSARIADVSPTGKALAIPLVLLATDAGYTMHCPRLPARTSIQVLIALADIRWNPTAERTDRPILEQVRDADYVMRIKFDDFSTYWLGHANADDYAPRPKPQWVKVEGEYEAVLRTRSVSQKIDLARHPGLPF